MLISLGVNLLAVVGVRHAAFELAEGIHVRVYVLIKAMILLAEYIAIPRSGSARGTPHDKLHLCCRRKPRLHGHFAVATCLVVFGSELQA